MKVFVSFKTDILHPARIMWHKSSCCRTEFKILNDPDHAYTFSSYDIYFYSCVYINNSSDITVNSATISCSRGSGLLSDQQIYTKDKRLQYLVLLTTPIVYMLKGIIIHTLTLPALHSLG